MLAAPASAQSPNTCSGYTVCPIIDFQDALANDPGIRQLNANITSIEMETLNQILNGEYRRMIQPRLTAQNRFSGRS
jgi:hypothetical protein